MRTSFMLIAAVVLALLPAAGLCAAGPFIIMESGSESVSLTAEEIRDGKEASIEAVMEAATGASGPESVMFLLRRGSPNGTNLTAIYGNAGENLLGTLPPAMRGFDEYGELEEGYSLQVAVRDLNGDKKPDVLVATATVLLFSRWLCLSTRREGTNASAASASLRDKIHCMWMQTASSAFPTGRRGVHGIRRYVRWRAGTKEITSMRLLKILCVILALCAAVYYGMVFLLAGGIK